MNQQQRLFLIQARSDYELFRSLKDSGDDWPECHLLHYLQMAAEKLAKAFLWHAGFPGLRHATLVRFLRALVSRDRVRRALGYENRAAWNAMLHACCALAYEIERLAPSEAGDGPNVEYPWPPQMPMIAPANHAFPVWDDIRLKAPGRRLLQLLDQLLAHAETCF